MSSKASHTPGRWVSLYNWYTQDWTIETDDGYRIAEIPNVSSLPENEANARLIAAAPDMLSLLERIRNDPSWRTNDNALWIDLLRLIAEATGETAPSAIPNETGA